MSGTVSQREYARSRGVTHGAIGQAVREGRIPTEVDGSIDPAAADATWYVRHQQTQRGRALSAEAEARREQALLTVTVAKVQMTRRRAEHLRARLVDRDKTQAAIGALVERLFAELPGIAEGCDPRDAALLAEAVEMIRADLGDLHAEALRVTRTAGDGARDDLSGAG